MNHPRTITAPATPEGCRLVAAFATPIPLTGLVDLANCFARVFPDSRITPTLNGWTFFAAPAATEETAEGITNEGGARGTGGDEVRGEAPDFFSPAPAPAAAGAAPAEKCPGPRPNMPVLKSWGDIPPGMDDRPNQNRHLATPAGLDFVFRLLRDAEAALSLLALEKTRVHGRHEVRTVFESIDKFAHARAIVKATAKLLARPDDEPAVDSQEPDDTAMVIPCPRCGEACDQFDHTGMICHSCQIFFDSGLPEDATAALKADDPALVDWLDKIRRAGWEPKTQEKGTESPDDRPESHDKEPETLREKLNAQPMDQVPADHPAVTPIKGRRKRQVKDGQPCGHPGCLHHVSHPCEGCGRRAGHGDVGQEQRKPGI